MCVDIGHFVLKYGISAFPTDLKFTILSGGKRETFLPLWARRGCFAYWSEKYQNIYLAFF